MSSSSPAEHQDTATGGVAQRRARFNRDRAPAIAAAMGLPPRWDDPSLSKRFAFFADGERLAVVAGPQEGDHVELALAHAVRHADGREVVLVLPKTRTNATAQRVPWLRATSRPTMYVHDTGGVEAVPERTPADAVQAVVDRLSGKSPADELAAATRPPHFAGQSGGVRELVEQVTRDRRLDRAHRRGGRSWHYAGQRVLSIRRSKQGLVVTAGIHHGGAKAPTPMVVPKDKPLTREQLKRVLTDIEAAIAERSQGEPPIHRPDEHWLQSVIRRDPTIVGVEQPALRELPAWRPRDNPREWGRGFIDLIGLDGHGDIRIIETKLATNADDLLVLQGLDYFVWTRAYEQALRDLLGAPKGAGLELHYVLGASIPDGDLKHSPCTEPLAAAIDPKLVPWRSQLLRDWCISPGASTASAVALSDPFEMLT